MADPFSGSQNSRAGNALQKRQEALKRWKGSETDRESSNRLRKTPKIQFSSGTVFLSAISSGDVDEVKKLLEKGADINFQNVDGLTALHQACIDENYDLVKLLVDKGARLDLRDNEGWTPLHAAASCGSVEIAQHLIDNGADIAAVNNEGELPLDLAEEEEMEDLLTEEIENQGIDVEEARGEEERIMVEHAQSWLNKRKVDETLDRSGATALHVACAKGYVKVVNLLLQVGVDVDALDKEGWTPVHAAAHWGQQDALEILADHGANLNARTRLGQTAVDLAEPDIVKLLEELKKKQHDRPTINATTPVIKTNTSAPPPLKRSTLERNSIDHVTEQKQNDIENDRSSITRIKDSKLYVGDAKQERAVLEASRDVTSPKSKLAKPPGFPDSPKEHKENNKKRDDSEESDSEESEESTEESEEEEHVKSKPNYNSLPSRVKPPTTNANLDSESDGSESETEDSSSSEEVESIKSPAAGSVRTPSVSRAQSTSLFVTSPTSKVSSSSKLGNFASSKSSSFSREKKEEPVQSRFTTYPLCTTGSPTSTTSTVETRRSKVSSASSDDNKEADKTTTKTTRGKRVTRRAPTGFVGGVIAPDTDDKEREKQVNSLDREKPDITGSRSLQTSREDTEPTRSSVFKSSLGRSSATDGDTSSSYLSRRIRLSSSDDKNDADATSGRRNVSSRFTERAKDNEEPEVPSWIRRRQEREREKKEKEEQEKAEREKAEKEREEREKARKEREEKEKAEREKAEKEKEESQVPSWRRFRNEKEKEREKEKEKEKEEETSAQRVRRQRKTREKRRGTGVAYMPDESDEDQSTEAKNAKKNTKLNEGIEDEPPLYARRRPNKTEESVTERSRIGRTTRANAVPETTETDPKKLKEKLQDVQVELQDYKVKLEKVTQEKEALQRKLSQTEDELKQANADNQRLKDENGALIRVISKLSRTPT